MKQLFTSMYPLFIVTALITHFWTFSIALNEGSGPASALLTLLLPFISEFYWVIKTGGQDNIYAGITAVHLALGTILIFSYTKSRLPNIIS